ncbi:conserved protein of unknown function [Bradyrhizobium sp. ORS 285]|uniref:hypothetical protein n=1 Tax=Bradyrhizobium sp. ORS 285 TaxID=115808 RepID=UPI000240A631|nr:hypothetical protein [Bradyrhizobium sp. ORS 285]CCD88228.1 conserved hypothetical protein [Bradyrhizobium sp. ORS 285]SMX58420.1 conserved protein of unknown function [Bradyrhizobium sp. ORS 285]
MGAALDGPHAADELDAPADRDLELLVPYALFENDERLTRPFRTEREVWEAAEQADLVTLDPHGEKVLDNNFEIKPCEATPDELTSPRDEIVLPKPHGADATDEHNPASQSRLSSRKAAPS